MPCPGADLFMDFSFAMQLAASQAESQLAVCDLMKLGSEINSWGLEVRQRR